MKSTVSVVLSKPEDLEMIFNFYELAIAHQKKVSDLHWNGFEEKLVQLEIAENRQYKILIDHKEAGVFAITFSDPQIWGARNADAALYIHRIVTHPDFRGFGLVQVILDWAKSFAKQNELSFIRIDTWAANKKLFSHYTGLGFEPAGTITILPNSGLPKHYDNIELSLFEIKL